MVMGDIWLKRIREFKSSNLEGQVAIYRPMGFLELLSRPKGLKWWNVTLPKWGIGHISYDSDVVKDYFIIRQQTHDGTLLFTYDLIFRALMALINKTTYYKPKGWSEDRLASIRYVIGDIRLSHIYKDSVDLPVGRYPGLIERLRIPVRYYIDEQRKEGQGTIPRPA